MNPHWQPSESGVLACREKGSGGREVGSRGEAESKSRKERERENGDPSLVEPPSSPRIEPQEADPVSAALEPCPRAAISSQRVAVELCAQLQLRSLAECRSAPQLRQRRAAAVSITFHSRERASCCRPMYRSRPHSCKLRSPELVAAAPFGPRRVRIRRVADHTRSRH